MSVTSPRWQVPQVAMCGLLSCSVSMQQSKGKDARRLCRADRSGASSGMWSKPMPDLLLVDGARLRETFILPVQPSN